MDDRTQYELKHLIERAGTFLATAERFSRGARYRRNPERMREFYRRLLRSREYLERAADELTGRREEMAEAQEPEKTGWFRSKMSELTRNLIAGLSSSDGGEPGLDYGDELADEIDTSLARVGFHGDSWSISIPDILGLLQAQGKDGVLELELESETICIELNRGDLVHAYSKNPPARGRLGEILVEQGVLTQERLDSFLFCFTGRRGPLGEALKGGELVTEDQLRKALDYQVQQLFHRVFAAKNCKYSFFECPTDTSKARRRRNITSLLLESARMVDESSAVQGSSSEPRGPLPRGAGSSTSSGGGRATRKD